MNQSGDVYRPNLWLPSSYQAQGTTGNKVQRRRGLSLEGGHTRGAHAIAWRELVDIHEIASNGSAGCSEFP